ncbi:hypothetical protein B0O80DRAFT_498727 [Mortierella sp. GBAus27b]|nr:hypothetical protein BGX31_002674 [Mortierella sp. GBA43]KAI8353886.1 hypothetical protein B0O80DRAFT_498727 [Mortierella sp. GBAus27b]
MTDKLANTANQYIGGVKQTVGETLGYPGLAARGAAQKSEAESAQRISDAQADPKGAGHSDKDKDKTLMKNDTLELNNGEQDYVAFTGVI